MSLLVAPDEWFYGFRARYTQVVAFSDQSQAKHVSISLTVERHGNMA